MPGNDVNFWSIAPQLILVCFGFLLMLIGAAMKEAKSTLFCWVTVIGLFIAFIVNVQLYTGVVSSESGIVAFSRMIVFDELTGFFNTLFIGIGVLVCLISSNYIEGRTKHKGEYFALILFSIAGMSFMVTAMDFIILIIGLETMSLAIYILAGIFKNDERSAEASIKYFLLGSFSTAFLLMGIAFLYGSFGTTNFGKLFMYMTKLADWPPTVYFSGIFILAGVVFKIAAVPFHMWTPDVYEGAPTSITAFMATAVKAAAFAILLKIFLVALKVTPYHRITDILYLLSILTMTLGNLSALAQKSVKRMLAYSSIAHAGYLLIGFVSLNTFGLPAILFYLVSYALMNIGAFSVIMLFEKENKSTDLTQLSGAGFKHPFLGVMMIIFMFGLAGVPPTSGFTGKFFIFTGAIKEGYLTLAIIGVLNSAISAYYYLRVLIYMYFKEDEGAVTPVPMRAVHIFAMLVAAIGVLNLGIFPQQLYNLVTSIF